MALNKKMHPRNPYKKPPSFKELALKNDEFRQHAKVEISGKVSIDFKNADALRALTRALLKEDWNLDVNLPPEYLVPTLPLRLNYILWLEDLIATLKQDDTEASVFGIDIGTGASCIYPLLAAKKSRWHMIGTEKNEKCFHHAVQNVLQNGLQSLIKVCKVEGEAVMKDVFTKVCFDENPPIFDFTMCNPPFFASEEQLEKTRESRSPSNPRPPPPNARTGSANEVVVDGGEVTFVLKMINESSEVKDKVKVFSTMLGLKSSVSKVVQYLKDKGIKEVATTEFCQGRVTRWGVAWSYVVKLSSKSLHKKHERSKPKPKPPLRHVIPCTKNELSESFESVHGQVKLILKELNMECKCVITDASSVGYKVTAFTNTWSNQRRKRRDKARTDSAGDSLSNCCDANIEVEFASSPASIDESRSALEGEPPQKKVKKSHAAPLVVLSLTLQLEETDEINKKIVLELSWLQGSGGRETVHQIMQYIKNNLQ